METVFKFRELVDDWYIGLVKIGEETTCISGECPKNPADHLLSAYRFFVNGGIRAQCVFNQAVSSQLIVLRREHDRIYVNIVALNERFENNAKLGSNNYLDDNLVFSGSISLTKFAKAIVPYNNNTGRFH